MFGGYKQQSFEAKWDRLLNAIEEGKATADSINSLLANIQDQASKHPEKLKQLASSNRVKLILQQAKHKDLFRIALEKWLETPSILVHHKVMADDEIEFLIPSQKNYTTKDNQTLVSILQKEFEGQDITNSKATYAWKYKSGQESLTSEMADENEMNIFFLGTSTPPLFGKHNVDVCETGHIIAQASLQKGLRAEPSVLVKGIATLDMDKNFPLEALTNPNIQGISKGGIVESFRKTKTTVKGVGAQTRVELSMDNFFVPNLFQMILKQPLNLRGELKLNLVGHSRGGITTFIMADCANQFIQLLAKGHDGKDFDSSILAKSMNISTEEVIKIIADIQKHTDKIKINIVALDPVEGARSMSGWSPLTDYVPDFKIEVKGIIKTIHASYVSMPSSVQNATIFLAADERRSGFKPTIPLFSENTRVNFIRVPGKHGTLTGNFGNDSNQGQFHFPALENDQDFQDALLGIFDDTLITLNKKLYSIEKLPPFPLNTFRRIFIHADYDNTKNLLLQSIVINDNSLDLQSKTDDELIAIIEKQMLTHPELNIVFYDCLSRDAQASLLNHRDKLPLLQKQWRHDTNVHDKVDRDAWEQERGVFIRGKKVHGVVSWHPFQLNDLAPFYLPNTVYYGQTEQSVVRTYKNAFDDEMVVRFYQIKSKIDTIAHTYNMSPEEASELIFDKEFEEFVKMLPKLNNKNLRKNIIAELMIDLDYKYHLLDSIEFSNKLHLINNTHQYNDYPQFCLQVEMDSFNSYISSTGYLNLSLEETSTLSEHVNHLMKKLNVQDDSLLEIRAKLTVKDELDQYTQAIEAYIEFHDVNPFQGKENVQKLKNDLDAIRSSLPLSLASEIRDLMDKTILEYKQEKQSEISAVRAWIKPTSDSVTRLEKVESAIKIRTLEKQVNILKSEHREEWVKQDLERTISELSKHISSYRLGLPSKEAKKLLSDLQILKESHNDTPIWKIEKQMSLLVDNYINDKPLKVAGQESSSVKLLKGIQEDIRKLRYTQAQEALTARNKNAVKPF